MEGLRRFPATASVAAYLRYSNSYGHRGLVLVSKDTVRWGLPAGGIEVNEQPLDALRREVWEETSIKHNNLWLESLSDRNLRLPYPIVVASFPLPDRVQVGIIYTADYHGSRLPYAWTVENKADDEIVETSWAQRFSMRQILGLLQDYINGKDVLYKPHINFVTLMYWVSMAIKGDKPKYIDRFFTRNLGRIENLSKVEDWLFKGEYYWVYRPPFLGEQDPEAARRRSGYK